MIELSVVIVSYNTKRLLEECLSSLYTSLESSNLISQSEVIVVDNASIDKSAEIIKKQFPKVIMVKNSKNVGFGSANNQGIKIAKGEFILLLNSDTKLFKNTVNNSLLEIKKRTDVGVLGGKLLNPDNTIQQSCGYVPDLLRVFSWMFFIDSVPLIDYFIKPYHLKNPNSYNKQREIDWVTGAFFLIRKKALNESDLFDPKVFMYIEEVEFCYRLKKRGWKILYTPETSLIHYKGGSGQGVISGIIEELKGIEYFYKKHYSPISAILVKVFLKGGALLRVLVFAIIKGSEEKRKLYLQYLQVAG